MALSKRLILDAVDLRTEEVDVPEWSGTVLVRELSAAQMAEFKSLSVAAVDTNTRKIVDGKALFRLSAWTVAQAVIDEDGQRLFTDAEVDKLREKSDVVIDRLSAHILQMSQASATAESAAKNS